MLDAAVPVPGAVVDRLVRERVASRLAARALGQARPGWVDAARLARPLAGQVAGGHAELAADGVTRAVAVTAGAAGLNAAALGPAEPRLRRLDTADAGRVADVLEGDLDALALVVSLPPGVDRRGVDAVTAVLQDALRAEGVDPVARTVAVVPPGERPPDAGVVVEGPADVHDAWTAFTPYALVPAGIAGADVGALLAGAGAQDPGGLHAHDGPENPALVLGALLAGAADVELAGADDAHVQLVTALRGPRPVQPPLWTPHLTVATGAATGAAADRGAADVRLSGDPAGVLHLLQRAVAVAGHLLGVDPTDPPPAPDELPPLAFRDGAVDVHAGPWLPAGTATVRGALHELLARRGTAAVALHAHLDPDLDASLAVLRERLARRTGRTTTFTWAPGRPPAGDLTVQVTGDVIQDGPAPPGPGPDGLRLHLHDRLAGLVTLARAVQDL